MNLSLRMKALCIFLNLLSFNGVMLVCGIKKTVSDLWCTLRYGCTESSTLSMIYYEEKSLSVSISMKGNRRPKM